LEPRLWLVRAGMVEIGDLILSKRGFRVQIAYIEGALDVVLNAGAGIGDDPHRAGDAALAWRAETDPGATVDDEEAAVGVPPDRALQRVEFIAGQEILGAFPDPRRLGDMRVAIERREILRHRRKALNRHPSFLSGDLFWAETIPVVPAKAGTQGH